MLAELRCTCGTQIPTEGVEPGSTIHCPGCGNPFYVPGIHTMREQKGSVLALIAMIGGLLPCTFILGPILGVIALFRIGASGGTLTGKGFAWTGTIAGMFWTAGFVALLLVIPQMLRKEISKNETGMYAALVKISHAQKKYLQQSGDPEDPEVPLEYWIDDVAGLYYEFDIDGEAPMELIPKAIADADADPRGDYGSGAPTPYSGYLFKAIDPMYIEVDGEEKPTFAVCAYPAEYGLTGVLTVIMSQTGLVWVKDNTGDGPVETWPVELIADGWTRPK